MEGVVDEPGRRRERAVSRGPGGGARSLGVCAAHAAHATDRADADYRAEWAREVAAESGRAEPSVVEADWGATSMERSVWHDPGRLWRWREWRAESRWEVALWGGWAVGVGLTGLVVGRLRDPWAPGLDPGWLLLVQVLWVWTGGALALQCGVDRFNAGLARGRGLARPTPRVPGSRFVAIAWALLVGVGQGWPCCVPEGPRDDRGAMLWRFGRQRDELDGLLAVWREEPWVLSPRGAPSAWCEDHGWAWIRTGPGELRVAMQDAHGTFYPGWSAWGVVWSEAPPEDLHPDVFDANGTKGRPGSWHAGGQWYLWWDAA